MIKKLIKLKFFKGREVVFQCRDEGPLRARVQWVRLGGNRQLPPGARDVNGRLEIPNIKVIRSSLMITRKQKLNSFFSQPEHSGQYSCQAVGYPQSLGGSTNVVLTVEKCK